MDNNIKKILPYALFYKKNIVWNVIFNVLYALFSTLGMVMIIPVMNVLFGEKEKVIKLPTFTNIWELKDFLSDTLYYHINHLTEVKGAQYALYLIISIIIIIFLLKNLFGFLGLQHLMKLKTGVLRDFREKMYAKIVDLPVSFYSEKRKGDVMARMLGDVSEVQNSFFAVLELIVKEPLTIILTLIAMFSISWELTLFVFIFIPISGLIISQIGKSLKSQSTRAQQENGYMISVVEETLSGLKVVKGYNAEGYFKRIFNESVNRLYILTNKIGKKNNLASPMSEFLGIATIAVLLIYGGTLVLQDGSLTGGAFIGYIGMAYNILTPAKAISKASYQVKNGSAAAERVFEILETPNVIRDTDESLKITSFNDKISLKDITFSYDGERNVLKNFNLDIPKGKTVALVGQSGSGKSTIANLLMRFYDVENGTIAIDSTNIKDIQLFSLRNQLGLVTQDSIMFNGSIADNVRIGKLNATDDEVVDALKIANAYEFVQNLPEGINTNIGDAGGKLSGGQKQRISIARAVLKNPPIMVLDEATSALDTESERLVQDALEKMMANRTSVVIAHRLSTIQKADVIVVMHRGEIAEQGTHDELIAKNGTYAKLVSLQSFES
ncbi:ABC transporter ATP-binding protein [Flavobacterium sp. xlx-214]|uniref:ABC transporter ATP-binding protein n=1 Tax=unclassified Flavobacterium TaxID=196869 RepID=UPI0013D284C2|nr:MULTISPECIES: ABC transporter ATP-binding protein [unclassified Flavobacterium]MBA5793212.1 ABC transporter ATP-binding protein [Flavobacterium sp. xlx-221]QMI82505.1 ABC transporter ATP-binding protein [Flavobacterium sp. xlx-214]